VRSVSLMPCRAVIWCCGAWRRLRPNPWVCASSRHARATGSPGAVTRSCICGELPPHRSRRGLRGAR